MTTSTAPARAIVGSSDEYDFEHARGQWCRPPFDNIGYLSSAEVVNRPAEEIRGLVARCEAVRYCTEPTDVLGRNHKNRWRGALGLDSTTGKRIMDFGCGMGIEALQFARKGNRVVLADIAPDNLRLAARVLEVHGCACDSTVLVEGKAPFFQMDGQIDIFYSNGVLHHTPQMGAILERAHQVLKPGGEARLMLYTDKAWVDNAGPLPAIDADVAKEPGFARYVKKFDDVGAFADWYSADKIKRVAGRFFELVSYEYITKLDWYCAAILRRK